MAQVVPLLIIIPDWSYRPSPFYHCNDKVFYLKLQEFRTPGSKIRKVCRVATKRHAWGALDGAQIKFIEFPWANAKRCQKGAFYTSRTPCVALAYNWWRHKTWKWWWCFILSFYSLVQLVHEHASTYHIPCPMVAVHCIYLKYCFNKWLYHHRLYYCAAAIRVCHPCLGRRRSRRHF